MHRFEVGQTVVMKENVCHMVAKAGATAVVERIDSYNGKPMIYINWNRDDGLAGEQYDGGYYTEYFRSKHPQKYVVISAVFETKDSYEEAVEHAKSVISGNPRNYLNGFYVARVEAIVKLETTPIVTKL